MRCDRISFSQLNRPPVSIARNADRGVGSVLYGSIGHDKGKESVQTRLSPLTCSRGWCPKTSVKSKTNLRDKIRRTRSCQPIGRLNAGSCFSRWLNGGRASKGANNITCLQRRAFTVPSLFSSSGGYSIRFVLHIVFNAIAPKL
jgi:hypothetical protein